MSKELKKHVWSTDEASQGVMLAIVKAIEGAQIAEIGTCVGATSFFFAENGIAVYTCDINDQRVAAVKKNYLIEFVEGDSRKLFDHIESKQEKISAIFIDGDHSYAGLTKDFKAAESYIRRNPGQVKYIFVHDCDGIDDVQRFCDEQLRNPFYNQIRVQTFHPQHGHPNGLAIFQLKY